MQNSVFVGRETEIAQLNSFLEKAAQGKPQVVFVTGEAGSGKSSLVNEFIRRSEEADPKLITSMGECNAQTGIADPYLPFRQILTTLTTENEKEKISADVDKKKKLGRWKDFVEISTKTLLMLGPDLIGIFVPGGAIIGRLGMAIGLNANLATKLSKQVGKKSSKENATIDPALDQAKIFEQYAAVLKTLAKDRTLILVLDDLQWADSGSAALLFHLARELKDSRLLLVGTYRPDDVALGRDGGRHPLESILNELKRYYGDIEINLSQSEAREGRAFVDALVDSEPNKLDRGFRDDLYVHTGGHPLFTVELLRNLQECGNLVKDGDGNWIQSSSLDWEGLPARIEGVIGERIARLPADLHETLTIGSVSGLEFAAQVIGRVQKVDERELVRNLSRELEKRYMLVVEEGETRIGQQYLSQYRFSHVLTQQYLYDEISKGERRILHGDIANILENIYGDQACEIALQLARHHEEAGNAEKAIAYLVMAGDDAFSVYAYNEAIAAYSRAIELDSLAPMNSDQLTHIFLRRGRALELIAQFDDALKNYDALLAAAQKRQDRAMELASKVAASTLYSTPTPVADATRGQLMSEDSLKMAQELGDRATEAKVLWNMLLVNTLLNRPAEAINFGEKSLDIARELNLREHMAYVLSDLGWAYNIGGQFEKASERIKEGTLLWRELGNIPMLANNLNASQMGAFWNGRDDEALSTAEETYQISASIKEVWNQSAARTLEGQIWLDRGEIDKGLAALEEGIQLVTQGHPDYVTWYRAILYGAYGDLGAADVCIDSFRAQRVPNSEIPDTILRTGTLVGYALYEIASNQLETAAATLDACNTDAPPWEAILLLAKCRLALAQADLHAGQTFAESAVALTQNYKIAQFLPEALFLKGKSSSMQGDPAMARMALEQARTEAEKLGSRRLLWRILAALAEIESDKKKSTALTAEARRIVEYIANHITRDDLRKAFVRLTELGGVVIPADIP